MEATLDRVFEVKAPPAGYTKKQRADYYREQMRSIPGKHVLLTPSEDQVIFYSDSLAGIVHEVRERRLKGYVIAIAPTEGSSFIF